MKKLLIFLSLLLITVNIDAQIIRANGNYVPITATEEEGGYTTQFEAVLDDFTWSYTGDTLTWMDDMVYSLDSAGYWDGFMELFYLHTVNNIVDANINWVTPGTYTLTDPGSTTPPFIKYQGYDPANVDYLATGYIPSSHAVNITTTSATLGAWMLTEINSNDTPIGCSALSISRMLQLRPQNITNLNGTINSNTLFDFGTAGSSVGLSSITRRGAEDEEGYFNGAHVGDNTGAPNIGFPNIQLYVLANNSDGTANSFVDGIVSLDYLCKGATDDDQTKIYNILHRFMTRMSQ